ncbi:uncharacterized protein LOC123534072 [Mercenaria mercenaria]|uniref:uncharacterized protein LOC123534072 n=1 Tax=Mercenaria mercenaria TaxID=6596 RepID=UPI001E1DF050|nr:uncharacterized protein LOC123534072 [Mercenaria mercenaria]XP_053388919.1 uncharacterized protein LOC123534072 [Mercenaria mercenaria]
MRLEKEIKEVLGNTIGSEVSGMQTEVEKGTKEMAAIFMKFVKDIENTCERRNILDSQPEIGPEADTIYQLVEKQHLTCQTLMTKCTLKVTDGQVCDCNALDIKQQELVLFELERYLKDGVKLLTTVFKALKWSHKCIFLICASVFIYHFIYNSHKRRKEATKKGLNVVAGLIAAFAGSKLGALIGAVGGPIGVVVGFILGGMIGRVIGRYCGKGIFKIVSMIFFPKSIGGQGQPPIKGTKYSYGQPRIPGAGAIKDKTKLHGILPKGQPKITGAEAAKGLPKLW